MKKIITIIVVIMAMTTIGYTQSSDPRGLNRYQLSGEQSPLTIFTLPQYDPTNPNFFDGYSAKTAEELGLVGEVFWNEFDNRAEKGFLAEGAVIRFKNGFQWNEAYLEGCLKGGKPFFNRVLFPNKEIATKMPDKTLKVDGAATINIYNVNTATANPTATATNTPATKVSSDDGTWKDPNNGPDWGWQQKKTVYYCPYCGFSNCDGSCRSTTTTVTTKSGCNNCGTTNTQYEKQMLRNARANTVANYIMPIGNAVLGAFLNSRWQKPPVNNYHNYTINNPNDNSGGDGGNLPGTYYPSPNYPDPNGDGGNLPSFNGKKAYNNGLK